MKKYSTFIWTLTCRFHWEFLRVLHRQSLVDQLVGPINDCYLQLFCLYLATLDVFQATLSVERFRLEGRLATIRRLVNFVLYCFWSLSFFTHRMAKTVLNSTTLLRVVQSLRSFSQVHQFSHALYSSWLDAGFFRGRSIREILVFIQYYRLDG